MQIIIEDISTLDEHKKILECLSSVLSQTGEIEKITLDIEYKENGREQVK